MVQFATTNCYVLFESFRVQIWGDLLIRTKFFLTAGPAHFFLEIPMHLSAQYRYRSVQHFSGTGFNDVVIGT